MRFNAQMQVPIPKTSSRRYIVALASAIGALAVAWAVVPPASVPLYDGIGFPDDPYRYVDPPPGYQHTPPPSEARATSVTADGTNTGGFYVNSAENAAQVSLFIAAGSLQVPASASIVAVRATAVAPDGSPVGAKIDGNVYRIAGGTVADGHTTESGVSVRSGSAAAASTLHMRATTARRPMPSFYYRAEPSDSWRSLPGAPAGRDIYTTSFVGFGDYVLAFGASSSGGGSSLVVVWPILGACVFIAAVIVAVRVTRRRQQSRG